MSPYFPATDARWRDYVDGHDVSAVLVAEGLAQPWLGRKAE